MESTRTGISRPPERISTPAVPPCLLLAQTKKTSSAFQGSMQYSEKSCLGEAPPSVCLRCWNFFLHMTIYSGLRLHSQGTPLQANGPGHLLHSSVIHSVLQPLLLQYTTVLKSVLLQYTILLMSVHHGALLMQYTTCAKHPIEPLTTWHSKSP